LPALARQVLTVPTFRYLPGFNRVGCG